MSEELFLGLVLPISGAVFEAAVSVYAVRKDFAQIGISIFVLLLLGVAVVMVFTATYLPHLIVVACFPAVVSQLLLLSPWRPLRIIGRTLIVLIVIAMVALPFVGDGTWTWARTWFSK